jgi:hypothetical protein
MTAHIHNAVPHVSTNDRINWNGKADATDMTAHIHNAVPHVSTNDRINWNGKADATGLISHKDNAAIHITSNERASWNGRVLSVTAANIIYGTDAGGTVRNRNVSTAATANHIVQRNANGQITVPAKPGTTTDATGKGYVDERTGWKKLYSDSINGGINADLDMYWPEVIEDNVTYRIAFNHVNARTRIGTMYIMWLNGADEAVGYHDSIDVSTGISHRMRIRFIRGDKRYVDVWCQTSKVTSTGNTDWTYCSSFRIIQIDKERCSAPT